MGKTELIQLVALRDDFLVAAHIKTDMIVLNN
jgi:hypothetical protein